MHIFWYVEIPVVYQKASLIHSDFIYIKIRYWGKFSLETGKISFNPQWDKRYKLQCIEYSVQYKILIKRLNSL